MKKYAWLNINKGLAFSALSSLAITGQPAVLPEEIEFHGFLTQALFHSSDNNFFGQSDDGISPGLTEIGANVAYQLFDKLRFSAQGLYRRAGDVDPGSVRLDYGLVDLTLFNYKSGRIGIRGGRIKIPFGLYNETRDVPFTHPTILLPQGIYFDRSRTLLLSADGGSFYAEQRTSYGDFAFKFNVGIPLGTHKEIQTLVLGTGDSHGELEGNPAIATQLTYEINGGEYIVAVSYMDLELNYHPAPGEALTASRSHIQPLMFSAQYNGEKFTLTGEYNYRWNNFGAFAPEGKFVTESWYAQGSYQLLPQLQATVRYDVIYLDKDDKRGDGAALLGYPRHSAFANDWMVGLRWDISPSWMLRADYHRIHGTALLSQADNPDRRMTRQEWELFAMQLSFRF